MRHKGRNVMWSNAMDKCLIEALAIQAKNGNKVDKCFNENAYTAACIAVNTRFDLNLNNQKVINRLKTMKKRYKVMEDLLSQDGFWWNPNTEMIECDSDEFWKRYIAAHPDARGLCGKQIEMYDELKIVCGNYQAPSRWAKMKDESHVMEIKNYDGESPVFVSPSLEDTIKSGRTESYPGPPDHGQMPDGFQEPTVFQSFGQLPKQPRSADAFEDALMAVTSSIRRLTNAMEQSKCSIDATELLKAVMEIDGLEESKQMYAFEYLIADPVKARAFLTYNARMRKIYLFKLLWRGR